MARKPKGGAKWVEYAPGSLEHTAMGNFVETYRRNLAQRVERAGGKSTEGVVIVGGVPRSLTEDDL